MTAFLLPLYEERILFIELNWVEFPDVAKSMDTKTRAFIFNLVFVAESSQSYFLWS